MGSKWPENRFEDLLSEPVRNGIYKKKEFHGRGSRIVNMGELFGHPRLFDTEMKRVELTEKEKQKSLLQNGDLLFARRSLTAEGAGKCSIVKDVPEETTFESSIIRARPDPNKADSDFLYYFFSSPHGKYLIGSILRQVAVAGITGSDLKELPILTPGVDEQKSIAHILGTLDDKIELNRQMNATLEAMAQALFKSWFVDFDPVIDNALAAGNPIPEPLQSRAQARAALGDQRKPLPEAIQKQFPNRFVFNDDIGWVPEGWDARAIGDVFSLLGGHSFKSGEYDDGGRFGIVTIKNVQEAYFVEECTNRLTTIPEKMKPHCHLDAGDVLLSLTGNVGRVCIVSPGDYLLNQRVAKLIGNDSLGNAFAYFFFRQRSVYEDMLIIAKGTAQQNLSPIETAKILRALPNNGFIESVQSHLEAPFQKIVSNTAEIQSLSKIRDTLLPKLLSGQLRLPEAEQTLAQVM